TDPPDLHVDVRALGSLTFGGTRARTLARAGLIEVTDERLLRRFDAACTAEQEPRHGTGF
ncbi:MAG: sterol carrier protein domain-containing protein, partial [Pseudonocardia sp.]|nr:sterol carrier protein domain-containing protein [Pseudonocardia sp.]